MTRPSATTRGQSKRIRSSCGRMRRSDLAGRRSRSSCPGARTMRSRIVGMVCSSVPVDSYLWGTASRSKCSPRRRVPHRYPLSQAEHGPDKRGEPHPDQSRRALPRRRRGQRCVRRRERAQHGARPEPRGRFSELLDVPCGLARWHAVPCRHAGRDRYLGGRGARVDTGLVWTRSLSRRSRRSSRHRLCLDEIAISEVAALE